MKFDLEDLLAPLVALVLLAGVVQQTLSALRSSGAYTGRRPGAALQVEDPYARLEVLVATVETAEAADLRDPFGPPRASARAEVSRRPAPKPAAPAPAPPALPVLTSIIWDNDPHATIRYQGRDYSASIGYLFADFRVTSITRDQVVLDQSGQTIILRLPRKGE